MSVNYPLINVEDDRPLSVRRAALAGVHPDHPMGDHQDAGHVDHQRARLRCAVPRRGLGQDAHRDAHPGVRRDADHARGRVCHEDWWW